MNGGAPFLFWCSCAALSSGSALEQGMFWRVGARGEIVGETAGCGRGQDYEVGGEPSLCGTYLVGSSMRG